MNTHSHLSFFPGPDNRFVNGPFRNLFTVFGYDPRTDPHSVKYQVLDFRLGNEPTGSSALSGGGTAALGAGGQVDGGGSSGILASGGALGGGVNAAGSAAASADSGGASGAAATAIIMDGSGGKPSASAAVSTSDNVNEAPTVVKPFTKKRLSQLCDVELPEFQDEVRVEPHPCLL